MQIELLNRGLERREQANSKTHTARALQDVNPAADPLNRFGKVKRAACQKARLLLVSNHPMSHLQQVLAGECLAGRAQRATDTQGCRQTRFQM